MIADKELRASGMACVNLTPNIKQAISSMQGSEVLMVYNDDPASREGVLAWCRLTGALAYRNKRDQPDRDTILY